MKVRQVYVIKLDILRANCRCFAPGDGRNKSKEQSGNINGTTGTMGKYNLNGLLGIIINQFRPLESF